MTHPSRSTLVFSACPPITHSHARLPARRGPQRLAHNMSVDILSLLACTIALALWAVLHPRGTVMSGVWRAYAFVTRSVGRWPQRRVSPRLPLEHVCDLAAHGLDARATSVDLSEDGLSMRLTRLQPLPRMFDVTVTAHDGLSVTVQARLIRSELRTGHVEAAVQFVNRTAEQHRRLLALMSSAPGSRNARMDAGAYVARVLHSFVAVVFRRQTLTRLAPRFSCNLPAVLLRTGGLDVMAHAVDISHTGIGVRVGADDALEVGATASLTVHWNRFERTSFNVECGHARVEQGRVHLGLSFVRLDGPQSKDLLRHLSLDGYLSEKERTAA
jgi:hypothetical protein